MIYKDDFINIQREDSYLPWVKIFTNHAYKELSECDSNTRNRLFEVLLIVEKTMLEFYNPTKINIASFGNYVPHVHIHVTARFENDTHYPNSMWGEKIRDCELNLPNFDEFSKILVSRL
ncbi:hypothetical protein LMG7974_01190 [Campylobacter majalis]|uniref:HIT domain-containing protein n=1 Tax=Campylobacter majalis TaxID=2790656 RepID=A0ABN7KC33_9BACT|nr:HIT family protein [Campylobacter majalis]CAD7288877.1 hypothetical protein LMG7974_01190 [Campylobacter majalis]